MSPKSPFFPILKQEELAWPAQNPDLNPIEQLRSE